MPQSGGDPNWSTFSDGGVGAAAYSVNARLFTLAARGVVEPSVMVVSLASWNGLKDSPESRVGSSDKAVVRPSALLFGKSRDCGTVYESSTLSLGPNPLLLQMQRCCMNDDHLRLNYRKQCK